MAVLASLPCEAIIPTAIKNEQGEIFAVLRAAKELAKRYRALTGRPLGVTGEVAEYEAARLLDLDLAPAREAGFDATRVRGRKTERLQIKGRCLLPGRRGGLLGSIDIEKPFDYVLLVLLDENLEATAIYEATRADVKDALTAPGSKARNQRGQLSLAKFRSMGRRIWPKGRLPALQGKQP